MSDLQEPVKARIVGRDNWSRVIVKTEKGTQLCDINLHDPDVLLADSSLGDWHTMTPDYGEPFYRFDRPLTLTA